FTVPAAPWFTGTRVRPLRPGRYPVVVPCATTFEKPSGLCTEVGLEGYFELTGGGSGLCQTDANCAVLEASPGKGPPGTLLAVNGWAPLTGLNGGGFLQMAIEGHPPQSKLGSALPPPIASMPFVVNDAPPLASLPAMHPVTIQRTGMDPIRVDRRRPGALLVASDDGSKPATSISGRANDGRWQNLAGSEPALSGQRTVHRPRTTGQRSLHGRRRMAGHRNLHRWWAVLDIAWL